MGASGGTSNSVARGVRAVVTAMLGKPPKPERVVPTGAPKARAANIAMPTQAMTFPALAGPASASPQLTPPVMMKLSAAPSGTEECTAEQENGGRHTRRADEVKRQQVKQAASDRGQ